mgnify:CR=1 FL=1
MSQMFNVLTMAQQFRTNPMGMLAQRYNLPQGVNDPQQIIQHLLNTGQITQAQVNQAMQMRNSPMFKGLF